MDEPVLLFLDDYRYYVIHFSSLMVINSLKIPVMPDFYDKYSKWPVKKSVKSLLRKSLFIKIFWCFVTQGQNRSVFYHITNIMWYFLCNPFIGCWIEASWTSWFYVILWYRFCMEFSVDWTAGTFSFPVLISLCVACSVMNFWRMGSFMFFCWQFRKEFWL